jgi:hypothetical protein
MTHQRKPLHQSQRRLRGGGDEDEVVDVEDDKRIFYPVTVRNGSPLNCQRVGGFSPEIRVWDHRYSRVGGHKISVLGKPSTIELILNDFVVC